MQLITRMWIRVLGTYLTIALCILSCAKDDVHEVTGGTPEWSGSAIKDPNGDGRVDLVDVLLLVDIILGERPFAASADLDGNLVVDLKDLLLLVDTLLLPTECVPRGEESCNAIDDDCDGQVDEALFAPCGTDAGACSAGIRTCSNGCWSDCTDTKPTPEICDGIDNDCDGHIDDEGQCATCVPTSSIETCNFADDDCNGKVDEWNDAMVGCGTAGIAPLPSVPLPPVLDGLRYKVRVHHTKAAAPNWGKIVFLSAFFRDFTWQDPAFYTISTDLFTHGRRYVDNIDGVCPTWTNSYGKWTTTAEPSFVPRIMDWDDPRYLGRVGMKQGSPEAVAMFPRHPQSIDGREGFTAIASYAQQPMLGVDVEVELVGGDIINLSDDPLSWGFRRKIVDGVEVCTQPIPTEPLYREWIMTVRMQGQSYELIYVVPASHKLDPTGPFNAVLEFFYVRMYYTAYLWDVAVHGEGNADWTPIQNWHFVHWGREDQKGYGFKIGTHNGASVIEISNDGTDTYFNRDAPFEIPEHACNAAP